MSPCAGDTLLLFSFELLLLLTFEYSRGSRIIGQI